MSVLCGQTTHHPTLEVMSFCIDLGDRI